MKGTVLADPRMPVRESVALITSLMTLLNPGEEEFSRGCLLAVDSELVG